MIKKGIALISSALLCVAFSSVTLAEEARENNQSVVIGVNFIGIHNFSTLDDFRANRDSFGFELNIAGSTGYYGEWYLWDRWGLGLRTQKLWVKETTTQCSLVTFVCQDFRKEVNIDNVFLTLDWVPWISESSEKRIILFVGAGPSRYDVFDDSTGPGVVAGSQTATAIVTGAYLDTGGEDFGFRIGFQNLSVDHDPVAGLDLNASGYAFNLDLRWAFE